MLASFMQRYHCRDLLSMARCASRLNFFGLSAYHRTRTPLGCRFASEAGTDRGLEYLARRGHRQVVREGNGLGHLVASDQRAAMRDQVGLARGLAVREPD